MEKITVTLTHYRRLDHLRRTVHSFLNTNKYPIDQFLIIDDSGDSFYNKQVQTEYKEIANVIINDKTIGQRKSIDKMFSLCTNEYIFHLEDDWLFTNQLDTDYIGDSLIILKNNPDINQVWVRHEYDNPHKTIGEVYEIAGVKFKYVDPDFRGEWNGFSWNPGLRRKSDYEKFFPDGVQRFKDELQASKHVRNFNFKAVKLENTVCNHIGYDQPTQKNEFNL